MFRQSVLCLRSGDLDTVEDAVSSTLGNGGAAKALRLSFHDCVGGCDGCLNLDDEDNAGLEDIVNTLEQVYADNNLSELLSRADFWAYTAILAVERAVRTNNRNCDSAECAVVTPVFNFQYGRVDCDTAPSTDANVGHPPGDLDHDGLVTYFADNFGFNENETVALMGAHTLGGAATANSGHRGTWVSGERSLFNKNYYTIMVDASNGWSQRNVARRNGNAKYQWNSDAGFMLNADMAIYKDIQLDSTGASACTYEDCAMTPTADLVTAYAASNDLWMTDFVAVFTKMINHGNSVLRDLE